MEFETGEEVIWRGRPAYHIRHLILTVLYFFGIFVINLGPIGQAIGVISFFLMIIFPVASIASVFLDKGKKSYLTNRRVISARLRCRSRICQTFAWNSRDLGGCVRQETSFSI